MLNKILIQWFWFNVNTRATLIVSHDDYIFTTIGTPSFQSKDPVTLSTIRQKGHDSVAPFFSLKLSKKQRTFVNGKKFVFALCKTSLVLA